MTGAPAYRGAPPRRPADSQPARPGYPGRGPRYSYGYQGAPYTSGQRRRGAGYRRRRRYGWGNDGGYGPWYWTEPWTDDGYDATSGDGAPAAAWVGAPGGVISGDGIQASGRWVRRGRHIILYGA